MPQRQFTDPHARHWTVWDVRPSRVERELARQRPPDLVERRAHDRVVHADVAAAADGWLCFEGPGCKRRLAPIPAGWERLSDDDLRLLCERAADVAQRA
jgi:hypothetical protein